MSTADLLEAPFELLRALWFEQGQYLAADLRRELAQHRGGGPVVEDGDLPRDVRRREGVPAPAQPRVPPQHVAVAVVPGRVGDAVAAVPAPLRAPGREEGVDALFKGFAANVLRTLGGAIVLVGYDEIKKFLG